MIEVPVELQVNQLNYESYLRIGELTSLQTLISQPREHDEHLFILIHQSYELWFKQLLCELDQLDQSFEELRFMRSLQVLKRMRIIQENLVHQVDILETMTPNDFNRFRNILNPASGFQSFQFRLLEFRLGLKDANYLRYHKNHPEHFGQLESAMVCESTAEKLVRNLARLESCAPLGEYSRLEPAQRHEMTARFFGEIYENSERHYETYLLLEALADLDETFATWRYRHVSMVARMIGRKKGTGGSSGVDYLSSTLQKRFFPEIWAARNYIEQTRAERVDIERFEHDVSSK